MPLTASKLRQNIYRILDQALETGIPIEIERGGRLLRIVPAEKPSQGKLANLRDHPDALLCPAEDLVQIDWTSEWTP